MSIKEQIISISLLKISQYARNTIGNEAIATVHSSYNKTINLLINKRIFSIQPRDSELSPISLITNLTLSQFQQLKLQPIKTYQLHFNYQNVTIFYTKLTACKSSTKTALANSIKIAKQILQQSDKKGLNLLFQQKNDDLILAAFQQYLTQAEHFYIMNDEKNTCNILTKLIGLGIGLTPSGDDFLSGLLATFQYFNATKSTFYQNLTQQIRQNLANTNAISSRFLDCALQQQFSVPVLTFFENIDKQNSDIEQLNKLFENIGHSSGMDTLFGIYYGCSLLSKK
ncbi:hypothetical protein X808_13070 [Mannheimia varigena USDA-ARS-USMARC-1296]|uniref:DUF2877 domain-containing protein n=1 Tax=Mannheimia varigena USDA-ARS-USMARC-1296 TaxID=1433287 RepID=W0QD93_9PAST|nr:DUF2877 domain-containing protein [Mannheimia varigena]AHG75830.1 hypothetical protein X808_13070 [Mannheimia varigena USDA-ARS-USMARC-1296]